MKMDIESATDLALEYAKKAGYSWPKIVSAKPQANLWIIKIDVGSWASIIKTITIDDTSGKVVGYE
jgi:hypothetical protein